MAQPIQQVQPIPNGAIPIMAGGVVTPAGVQQGLVYQQPQVVVAGTQIQYATPRKPYIPRERHPNEEQCKIFVGAVGKDTTEETLRGYFSKFGEIADSVIMINKATGQPRGFAFVTFKNAESVQAVIDQNDKGGHTLDGKMVDPKPAVPQNNSYQQQQQHQFRHVQQYDAEKAAMGGNPGSANPQYKGPMKISPELKIFVGGIGIGTTEEDVRKYFEGFGKVVAVDMPFHHIYKCPKGFAFVGFESPEAVSAIVKDRYHQINGKTVEVKGADEQQAHMKKKHEGRSSFSALSMGRGGHRIQAGQALQAGNIATVSGYGAYGNIAAAQQHIVVPQPMQIPAASTGGYVFDPSTNTYYQLPGTVQIASGGMAGLGSVAASSPYAGMTIVGGAAGAGQQIIAASQLQTAGRPAIGAMYSNETSTFGPQRTHVLGSGGQQPIGGNTIADPHVVYSTSPSISAGDVSISTPRGFHPYGR